MPARFFEELIGKKCDVTLRDEERESGTLLAVDGDWLKLHDDYGSTIFLSAGQIISISVEDEKDDRESRWNRRKR